MKLYGIPNCSTVKKAREWLDSNNVAYEFHDFKKQGIDATTLQDWLKQQSWEKLVNRAGNASCRPKPASSNGRYWLPMVASSCLGSTRTSTVH